MSHLAKPPPVELHAFSHNLTDALQASSGGIPICCCKKDRRFPA